MNSRTVLILLWSIGLVIPAGAARSVEQWKFIDNGVVRLGITLSSGGGIGWFSRSGSTTDFINHSDHGRLIQQSYYGNPDGSYWKDRPWRWNPVQGGDWRGSPAKVLDVRTSTNFLYCKTLPKHWATGEDLTNSVMEEWIMLTGKVAHVRFKFTYSGTITHVKYDHEIPAVYVDSKFGNLVTYTGNQPWTSMPLEEIHAGESSLTLKWTEHWAAYVDETDHGVVVMVPIADHFSFFRLEAKDAKGQPSPNSPNSFSYFSPHLSFAIKPGTTFTYDAYITIGSSDEIRKSFMDLKTETVPHFEKSESK